MAQYTHDSFDRLPERPARVGAHRGPRPRGRGWMVFAWAALATVVLVGLGIGYLAVINNNIQFTDAFAGGGAAATATPTPTEEPITPIVDGTLAVTVLNGTEVAGLAGAVGQVAVGAGWNVATTANASTTDFATTTVFYSDPVNEAAALGLAQTLGGVPTELSTSFDAALTVVLGTDYTGPGSEGLVETPVDEAPAEDAPAE
ncbi:LytR C-terminal domain-containing protein [Herbiconiux moechotypicola]|uniref:LytR/CpsA/Psr regulator C-terminal domain-containing protein n=1 Tax=Herbiconiux moechotypicola TaxID=637393 RepID=A0ABP5QLX3_9MICO|nr:LytR C-terminal domain-containing protein [Herbiconiux moechotypicola]MCS5730699.1 LytR C-terminal domain-containing protein [Herbiconiux moechotypicola]